MLKIYTKLGGIEEYSFLVLEVKMKDFKMISYGKVKWFKRPRTPSQGAISGKIPFLGYSKTGEQKAEEEQEREEEWKEKRRQREPNLPFYA